MKNTSADDTTRKDSAGLTAPFDIEPNHPIMTRFHSGLVNLDINFKMPKALSVAIGGSCRFLPSLPYRVLICLGHSISRTLGDDITKPTESAPGLDSNMVTGFCFCATQLLAGELLDGELSKM